jgi:hypothetical protein
MGNVLRREKREQVIALGRLGWSLHGRTKRPVAAMFAEKKPSLQALPIKPFRYCQYGQQTVRLDGCVEVEAAYYGAPPGWIGRQVDVQSDAMFVRLLDPRTAMFCCASIWDRSAAVAASAMRIARGAIPPHTHRLLARAHKAGASIGAVREATRDAPTHVLVPASLRSKHYP